mgnify:FL=1
MKVQVLVDTFQPLLRGTIVKVIGSMRWIKFKYERCPNFYYTSVVIGHSEKGCKTRVSVGSGQQENQY